MIVSFAQLCHVDRAKLERLAHFLKLRPEPSWPQRKFAALVHWRIQRLRTRAWRA